MPPNTETWWVCRECEHKIARVKKGQLGKNYREHKKVCPDSTCHIKQVPQGGNK